jgi:hypothetical protein
MGIRRRPVAVLVLALTLVAGCGTTPPSGPEDSGAQLLQRGTVDGRTWVLQIMRIPIDDGAPGNCLALSWADEEGFVCQGSRLEDQVGGEDSFPLPDGRALHYGVVAPRATRVRVSGTSGTVYAPTHPFPHRSTDVRYYVVPADDQLTVVEPIDGSGKPAGT